MPQLMRMIFSPIISLPEEKFIWFDYEQYVRRLIDIIASFTLLIPCLIALPFVAIFVKAGSPGNLFYLQQRTGYGGKIFTIYKLRTMHADLCDDGSQQAVHKDTRVTRFGKILRHYSVDELPQLYNVLKGDMSLVGPRPHALPMDRYYSVHIPYYQKRYQIKPGITGLAQIRGSRGEIKTLRDMEQRILLDIKYIRKRSLFLDFLILVGTVRIVLRST